MGGVVCGARHVTQVRRLSLGQLVPRAWFLAVAHPPPVGPLEPRFLDPLPSVPRPPPAGQGFRRAGTLPFRNQASCLSSRRALILRPGCSLHI